MEEWSVLFIRIEMDGNAEKKVRVLYRPESWCSGSGGEI